MTTKELLYIEDALGHAQIFTAKCREAAARLSDPELKSCVEEMGKKNAQLFSSFYGLL